MNDFKPTQVVKIDDVIYPLYDLNTMRSFMLFTDDIPPEVPEQIKINCNLVKERLEPSSDIKSDSIALVGYGPTLKGIISNIKNFTTVLTMSGAHKLVLKEGVVPQYHVDVDFRERKNVHTKESHDGIQYLLGSTVHPSMLEGKKNVKLWHVALNGIVYPENELVLAGYWDVGQESILVAKALGYRKMHLIGYDYAFEVTGETHAGEHNGTPGMRVFAKVGDRFYQTSDSLVRGVLAFIQLMHDNADLELFIHGEGLLSAYLNHHFKVEHEQLDSR